MCIVAIKSVLHCKHTLKDHCKCFLIAVVFLSWNKDIIYRFMYVSKSILYLQVQWYLHWNLNPWPWPVSDQANLLQTQWSRYPHTSHHKNIPYPCSAFIKPHEGCLKMFLYWIQGAWKLSQEEDGGLCWNKVTLQVKVIDCAVSRLSLLKDEILNKEK